jgi:hypothetical protein
MSNVDLVNLMVVLFHQNATNFNEGKWQFFSCHGISVLDGKRIGSLPFPKLKENFSN